MSNLWDDFTDTSKGNKRSSTKLNTQTCSTSDVATKKIDKQDDEVGCGWGFDRRDGQVGGLDDGDQANESSKFIPFYKNYLQDKQGFINEAPTKNHQLYVNNPQRAIREWYDNEGHEFAVSTDHPKENEYICTLELPVDDHDFTLTSEIHNKKQLAIDEICLVACKLLDKCQLLYSWQSNEQEDKERKRRHAEACKEDDIELDSTVKRHCDTKQKSTSTTKVNTYESLMSKWMELNKFILQSKAKLVKLDLSVTKNKKSHRESGSATEPTNTEEDDEIDPLDEFMSNLETKTELTTDDKIEKSRLKSEIHTLEQEQSKVSRLIELAKPKFSLEKACPKGENIAVQRRSEKKKS